MPIDTVCDSEIPFTKWWSAARAVRVASELLDMTEPRIVWTRKAEIEGAAPTRGTQDDRFYLASDLSVEVTVRAALHECWHLWELRQGITQSHFNHPADTARAEREATGFEERAWAAYVRRYGPTG
jgi:hypothetical protein